MFDKELATDLIILVVDNISAIEKRTKGINDSEGFTSSEEGMILLDSVCMKLVAIGESIKSIDKVTNKELLIKYPEISWKQAMGMRDIIPI